MENTKNEFSCDRLNKKVNKTYVFLYSLLITILLSIMVYGITQNLPNTISFFMICYTMFMIITLLRDYIRILEIRIHELENKVNNINKSDAKTN